jgi:glycosyltransferase involved in cell wall biosynthesis
MMHIHISNQSKQTLGGGFIFIENLKKGAKGKARFVDRWQDAHAVMICSVTQTTREEILAAKNAKKKIIVRIDNMPKDSRNRGTAFSRMRDFGKMADVIVFQSQWAKDYVGTWLADNHGIDLSKSKVIYNGVDTDYFHYQDDPSKRGETYLFTTYNTDENKRFPEAAYDYHLRHRKAKKEKTVLPSLKLVGNFGKDLPGYNFDFFNGEKISYEPPISDRKKMGDIMRSCRYIYFPAFADASPNTVGEAMACGCQPLLINPIGGSQEVVDLFKNKIYTIQDMADQYLALVR